MRPPLNVTRRSMKPSRLFSAILSVQQQSLVSRPAASADECQALKQQSADQQAAVATVTTDEMRWWSTQSSRGAQCVELGELAQRDADDAKRDADDARRLAEETRQA